MKQYTTEELKQSPYTLMKYFFDNGSQDLKDIEIARKYYKKNSTSRYKNKRIGTKTFKRMFLKVLETYNNRIK